MIPQGYITKLQQRARAVGQGELLGFIKQLRALLRWAERLYMERELNTNQEVDGGEEGEVS